MKEKYYTPDIEDLYIGYECEVNSALSYSNEYIPTILGYRECDDEGEYYTHDLSDIIIMIDDGYGDIRTQYLTKEQIENEGWVDFIPNTVHYYSHKKKFNSRFYFLHYDYDTNKLEIAYDEGEYYDTIKFNGVCKSINEFRKIIKFLDLK